MERAANSCPFLFVSALAARIFGSFTSSSHSERATSAFIHKNKQETTSKYRIYYILKVRLYHSIW